jgi:hypothetical protein
MMRDSVKDKSYRATPLGLLVGRYIRWFRNEWGATPSTIRDYEAVLARMSLTLADKKPLDVTVEDLRDVIDLWADREPRTRAKVTSVIRAFWAWAEEQNFVPASPAARIRRPARTEQGRLLLPTNIGRAPAQRGAKGARSPRPPDPARLRRPPVRARRHPRARPRSWPKAADRNRQGAEVASDPAPRPDHARG